MGPWGSNWFNQKIERVSRAGGDAPLLASGKPLSIPAWHRKHANNLH
jgi:hypothetical protein